MALALALSSLLHAAPPASAVWNTSQSATAARTFYVAPTGDDTHPGTLEQPWRTIQMAARTLLAGDTVLIRGGIYLIGNGDAPIMPAHSGTPGNEITFRAHPGETVVIQGAYPTTLDRVNFGFNIMGQSYIRIEGLTIVGFRAGIHCEAPGHHITIARNEIAHNATSGISSTNAVPGTVDTEACDYLLIEHNRIHHNGYYLDGTPATRFEEGWGSGISINPHGHPFHADTDYSRFHTIIRNNIVYSNHDGTGGDKDPFDADHTDGNGILIDLGGPLPPLLIENNIVFDNGARCICVYGGQNVWIVGNTCYKNQTDPLFRHPGNRRGEMTGHGANTPVLPLKNVHVLNNIVYASADRLNTFFPEVDPNELIMENNLWFGGYFEEKFSPLGNNYILEEPRFVNPSSDPQVADFRLQSDSPAIDRGIGVGWRDAQLGDFDGRQRLLGGGYDLGAYEYDGVAVPTPPVPPAHSRVLHWRMDEGSGYVVSDMSGLDHHGMLLGNPTWTGGVLGGGLAFDGSDDYAGVADHDELSPHVGSRGEMTLSAWVNLTEWPAGVWQGRAPIVAKGSPGGWEYALYVYANGNVGFSLWQLGGASYGEIAGGSLPLNGWHHVVGTVKKGQSMQVYLDGVPVAQTTAFQGDTGNGGAPLYLARRGDGQSFRGTVDEVRLHSRALAADEVQALFQAVMPGSSGVTETVAEATATSAPDAAAMPSATPEPELPAASASPSTRRYLPMTLRSSF